MRKKFKLLKLKIALGTGAVLLVSFFVIFIICVVSAALCAVNNNESSSGTESCASEINLSGNVKNLPVSNSLITFIESWEGYSATGYRGIDSFNVTIGYGHVELQGESFTSLTKDEAQSLLIRDLKSQGYIESVQREFILCRLKQNQFDALVSLCYNIGTGCWNDLSLTGDIKSGAGADVLKRDFDAIDYVGSAESFGLLRRRDAEWIMYTQGRYLLNT